MRHRILIAVACFGLATAGCVTPGGGGDEGLITAFDEMVFGTAESVQPPPRFARWEEPVRIAVLGKVKPEHRAELSRAIAEARALTGLDIAVTGVTGDAGAAGAGDANVALFFEDGKGYLDYLSRHGVEMDPARWTGIVNGFCWAMIWALEDRLALAAVYIGGGEEGLDAPRLRQCVYHELAHVLGLAYHPEDAFSILDHVTAAETYTRIDRILLRLLYDRRLAAGMSRRVALDRAAAILGRGRY